MYIIHGKVTNNIEYKIEDMYSWWTTCKGTNIIEDKIEDKIKDKIVIRHVPNFDRWNQKEKLIKLFQHNALSQKKKFIW